jgi:hypothetical protein
MSIPAGGVFPASAPLVLHCYKHRSQTPLPDDAKTDPANAWYLCDTRAAACDALAAKYPKHVAYKADLTMIDSYSIMPAKAFVSGNFMGRGFGFNLSYETVLRPRSSSGRPPASKGFTMVNMQEMNVSASSVDYSGLAPKLWCQGRSKGLHILIQLELYTTYPGILMQDDATGDVYCYRPRQIIVLVPRTEP